MARLTFLSLDLVHLWSCGAVILKPVVPFFFFFAGHLDYFQFLPEMNDVVVTIHMQVFMGTSAFISLG